MAAAKNMPPAIILCGGKGTRLRDVTELLPKPLVPIGTHPVLWHIMRSYSAFGVKRFILCLGYKKETFVDYFLNFSARENDVTIKLGHPPKMTFHGKREEEDWEVTLADTGLESCTATRIRIASKYLKSTDRRFFLTYGDGVADVNIDQLSFELVKIPLQLFGRLSYLLKTSSLTDRRSSRRRVTSQYMVLGD